MGKAWAKWQKLGLPAAQRIRLTEGVSLSDLLLEDRL